MEPPGRRTSRGPGRRIWDVEHPGRRTSRGPGRRIRDVEHGRRVAQVADGLYRDSVIFRQNEARGGVVGKNGLGSGWVVVWGLGL